MTDEEIENEVTDEELDAIYSVFNDMMCDGKFFEIDVFISLMDPENMPLTMALGVLTTSAWCQDKLKNRTEFFNRVAKRKDVVGRDPTLLMGLEPKV